MFFEKQTFIVLDLETTGLDPEKDDIIEFAAVKLVNGEVVETLEFLINPEREIPFLAQAVTGIRDEDVRDQPIFDEVKEQIESFVADYVIIGHNIQFDLNFLQTKGIALRSPGLDTYSLSSLFFTEEKSLALEVLSERLQIEHKYKHRALGDVLATVELLKIIYQKIREIQGEQLQVVRNFLAKTDSPLKVLFADVCTEGQIQIAQNDKGVIQEDRADVATEVRSVPAELWAQKKIALWEVPFQNRILCELGCYFLEGRQKMIMALATPKRLQKLRDFLEKRFPAQVGVLWPMENYLCLKKWQNFQAKMHYTESETLLGIKIILWLAQTETGERMELTLTYPEYEVWFAQLAADANCAGEWHQACFWVRAQKRQAEKPFLLTLQAQLLTDVLPTDVDLVVGEARQLEDSFFQALKQSVRLKDLSDFLNMLRKNQRFAKWQLVLMSLAQNVELTEGYLAHALTKDVERFDYAQKIVFTSKLRADADLKELLAVLQNFLDELAVLCDDFKKTPNLRTHWAVSWLEGFLAKFKFFLQPDSSNELKYFQVFPDGVLILQTEVVELGEIFAEKMTARFGKILCVDENLAASSLQNSQAVYNFDYFKSVFDLPDAQCAEKITGRDQRNKAQVILPKLDQGDPLRAMCDLIEQTVLQNQGKTVVLFRAYAVLKDVLAVLIEPLQKEGYKILAQGMGGTLTKLKALFEEDSGRSVLFAMERSFQKEFWKVGDVKTIILHKIAFDLPNDPVIRARQGRYQNTFAEFALPRSVLSLKQVYLKLGKAEQSLVILDPRLTTKTYGRYFRSALAAM